MLGRDDFSQLTLACVQQLAKVEDNRLTFRQGLISPRWKRLLGRGNRIRNFGFVGQSNLFRGNTQSRVKNRGRTTRLRCVLSVVNPVRNNGQVRHVHPLVYRYG